MQPAPSSQTAVSRTVSGDGIETDNPALSVHEVSRGNTNAADASTSAAQAVSERKAAADLRLDGYVDLATPDRIEGWIVAHGAPLSRRTLEILVDGTLIGECKANEFREDLETTGLGTGDGRYAFFYDLGRSLAPGTRTIQVRDAQTKFELGGSPAAVIVPLRAGGALSADEDASLGPYMAYGQWEECASQAAVAGVDTDTLITILKQLALILDFEAICEIYDFVEQNALLWIGDGDAASGGTMMQLVANANARCGRWERAISICERGIKIFPQNLPLRRTLAAVLRYTDPQRAYELLLEGKDFPGFLQSPASIQMLLELSAQLHSSAFVRMQLFPCYTKSNPELSLQFANLEPSIEDKIHAVAHYFKSQGLAPLHLAAKTGPFLDRLKADANREGLDGPLRFYGDAAPLVSVIMTSYNSEQYLEAAVTSLLEQTYRNFELFIVDDVSSDGSLALARSLAARDRRIKVLESEENGGTYVAKNRALAQAEGIFVTCQDSDDWAHPEKLERQVNHLLSQPRCVANWSRWVRVDDRGQFLLQPWGRYAYMNPASLMFRRKPVMSSIGYFDAVRTGADTEFRQRIACQFGWAALDEVNYVLTFGRLHSNSLMTSGAAAVDASGFSPVRRRYASSWLDWHHANLGSGTGFYMAERQVDRKFEAPGPILPRPSDDHDEAARGTFRRLGLERFSR